MKYKMMWEALKKYSEFMIANGVVSEVSWHTLLDIMEQDEIIFEPEKRSSARTFLIVFVDALEFGFACWGVLTLVLVFMGRIAYVD